MRVEKKVCARCGKRLPLDQFYACCQRLRVCCLQKLEILDTKNGVVETHYGNGQLESRETYKNGKLDGLRESWYDNGQPLKRETYKDGNLDGLREHVRGGLVYE